MSSISIGILIFFKGIGMIVESIYVHFASKKIVHYKSNGVREVKNKKNQKLEFSEVLSYLNVYMIENNLKLVKLVLPL